MYRGVRGSICAAAALALALVPAATRAAGTTTDIVVHANTGVGEPEIHINPTNPANVVVGENDSGISMSRDGGATWKQVALPNPGDNVLAVQPDGTFVYSALDGDVRASRDGGASWASVGNWVGTVAAQAHAQAPSGPGAVAGRELGCNTPAPDGPVSTDPGQGPGPHKIGCDRPWLVADSQTGRLYVSFTDHDDASGGGGPPAWELGTLACRSSVLTNPAFECGRQYVSASGDGGRTWSIFRPFDSSDYPAGATGGFSGGPVAAHGILATAYIGARAPHSTCQSCVVFETSANDGVTWARHLVPAELAPWALVTTDPSLLFEPYAAADPSRPGRYAVMVLDAAQTHFLVWVTEDSGASWQGPARLGEDGGVQRYLPWIAYGPGGALGVMWRTTSADGSYAAWAAVAPAGGTRFAPPVRLSSAPSPGPVSQLAGDDASGVTLDSNSLLAAWGDRRTGSLGIRFARYRFAADPAVSGHLLTGARRCASVRRIRVDLRLGHGERVRSAELLVAGRRSRAITVRGQTIIAVVDLTGRPRGAVRVVLRVVTTAGTRTSVRTFHPCVRGSGGLKR